MVCACKVFRMLVLVLYLHIANTMPTLYARMQTYAKFFGSGRIRIGIMFAYCKYHASGEHKANIGIRKTLRADLHSLCKNFACIRAPPQKNFARKINAKKLGGFPSEPFPLFGAISPRPCSRVRRRAEGPRLVARCSRIRANARPGIPGVRRFPPDRLGTIPPNGRAVRR